MNNGVATPLFLSEEGLDREILSRPTYLFQLWISYLPLSNRIKI